MATTILQAGKFDPLRKRWSPILDVNPGIKVKRLKVATFNVWFAPFRAKDRCKALLEILYTCQADFIALQEVTPEFFLRILKTPWIRKNYYLSDTHGESIEPYGVLLLSRFPMVQTQLAALPSLMYRKAIFADFVLNGQSHRIVSLHLESQSHSTSWRVEQLQQIFGQLNGQDHVLLMGDYNFHDTAKKETRQLPSNLVDVWPTLYPKDAGLTENTRINLMRLKAKGKHKFVRFDRVLFRSRKNRWQPVQAKLLGVEPISPKEPMVFPSDHFGLEAELIWR